MDDRVNFDINVALKHYLSDPATIATLEADGALIECENDPELLSSGLINGILNPIVDSVVENPEALARSSIFDSLQFLLKCAPTFLKSQRNFESEPDSELFKLSRSASLLPTHSLSKILDLITSGLSAEADALNGDLETDEQDEVLQQRHLLEMYAFLLQWSISVVEVKSAEKPASCPPAKGRGNTKNARSKATPKDAIWDPTGQLQAALDTMCKVLKLKLGRIFMTTSERDTFVSLFTRPVYLILENEQRIKNTALRMHAFKVLCVAVKHHGHAFGINESPQSWKQAKYWKKEHKPPSYRIFPILSILLSRWLNFCIFYRSNMTIRSLQMRFSGQGTMLPILRIPSDVSIRDLSNKEFNSNDTKGPKSVSTFIIKLSELIPRLVIKQMTLLVKQLDSEVGISFNFDLKDADTIRLTLFDALSSKYVGT